MAEADGLRSRLGIAERDATRAVSEAEEYRQRLAAVEAQLVTAHIALGEEKGGRTALFEQCVLQTSLIARTLTDRRTRRIRLKDARTEAQQATAAAQCAEQAKLQSEAAIQQLEAALEAERQEASALRVALQDAHDQAGELKAQLTVADTRIAQRYGI